MLIADSSVFDYTGCLPPVVVGNGDRIINYESKDVLFTYLFRREKNEWKLVGFKPGKPIPNGTVQAWQTHTKRSGSLKFPDPLVLSA